MIKVILSLALALALPARAQVGPTASEAAAYQGLHAAAQRGDTANISRLVAARADLNARDPHGRTPLHVATFARQRDAIRALAQAGADLNLLEGDRYDAVTIAAVADDEETLRVLLSLGASAAQVTSRYDGTALIAAAHLGHAGVVAPADRGRRAAGSRQQPALDGADRIHRAGRRRAAPRGDAQGAGRCRRQPEAGRCPRPHAAGAGPRARLRCDGADPGGRSRRAGKAGLTLPDRERPPEDAAWQRCGMAYSRAKTSRFS